MSDIRGQSSNGTQTSPATGAKCVKSSGSSFSTATRQKLSLITFNNKLLFFHNNELDWVNESQGINVRNNLGNFFYFHCCGWVNKRLLVIAKVVAMPRNFPICAELPLVRAIIDESLVTNDIMGSRLDI